LVANLAVVGGGLGDTRRAAIIYRSLLPFAGRNMGLGPHVIFGPASHALGTLAVDLGQWADAERHFRSAIDEATRAQGPAWLAAIQADYGAALLARGEAQRAAPLLRAARATADSLGMGHLAARLAALGRAQLPPPEAVVMVEETEEEHGFVRIFRAVTPYQNYRRAGESIARGDRVLARGERLRPAELGLLAALNQARVTVFRQPRVAVISTGDELAGLGQQPAGHLFQFVVVRAEDAIVADGRAHLALHVGDHSGGGGLGGRARGDADVHDAVVRGQSHGRVRRTHLGVNAFVNPAFAQADGAQVFGFDDDLPRAEPRLEVGHDGRLHQVFHLARHPGQRDERPARGHDY
jgi:hypothetical protein